MTHFSLHKQVLDTLPDGVTIQDKDFNIIYQNHAMTQAFGSQAGTKCYTTYEGRERICEGCGILKAFETGHPTTVHRTALTEDGKVTHWENSCFPLFDEAGNMIAGVEVCRDVTHRVALAEEVRVRSIELGQLNDQLKRKTAELENAYEELKMAHSRMLQQEKLASIGQLAAGVAHEINNPLAFVISNLCTLSEYAKKVLSFLHAQEETIRSSSVASSATATDLLVQIERQRQLSGIDYILGDIEQIIAESLDGGDRMKQIVQNLRNFARLDECELKMSNLNQGLESTLKIVWNELQPKATITTHYGDLPETLCNTGQLNLVFMNLLLNAAQAIEQQGRIEIKTEREGEHIVIEVTDTGCGIPAEIIHRIFEPFFTTKDVNAGTGLGLSIAFDIVHKHGGEILVQSRPGEGSTFRIRLPIRTEH